MASFTDEFYEKYEQIVYRYLLSVTHDHEIAEELTQETFYQALKGINSFDNSCKFSTWLCAIAKNQLNVYRRKNPEFEELENVKRNAKSAESEVLDKVQELELIKLLHDMPEPYKEIMYMRIFGNMAFRDIGEIMGKSENWARVTFYRGKEKLRKEIEENERT